MSNGMISFIAGLGGGYLKGRQKSQDDERQAKLDAQNTELHTARMADLNAQQDDRQNERDYKSALKVVGSTGKQDTGYQVSDIAGSNAFTKDSDAAGMMADMSAAKNEGTQTQDATRVSTGRQGATMQGTVAGSKVFTDPTQAQAFAKTQSMSDYTQMKARQDVANEFGKMDVSDEIRSKLGTLEKEGAYKTLTLAHSGDLAGAYAHWNANGSSKFPEGSQLEAREVPDPVTKLPKKIIALVGADGKDIVPDLDHAARTYLTPTEQYTMNKGDAGMVMDERRTSVAERAAETSARAQAANEKKIDFLISGGTGGSRGGSGGGGGGGGSAASGAQAGFNPLGTFDSKKAQAVAFDQAAAKTDEKGQPLTPEAQGALAQKIYRGMEDSFAQENTARERARVFKTAAATARTPEDLQALKARAFQSGYTEQEIAGLDPRFTGPKTKSPEDVRVAREVEKLRGMMAPKNGSITNAQTPGQAPMATPMVSSIEQIQANSVNALRPLAAQVKQAEQKFAAVVRSGDTAAINRYLKEKEALRTQLEGAVNTKFGNAATKVLQQLYAQ